MMEKMSARDLEIKITCLHSTVETLKGAITEVNCEKAKRTLQMQVDAYCLTLQKMLSELSSKQERVF
jgi:hypothetical protein